MRTRYFSGGSSIDLHVKDVVGWRIVNPLWVKAQETAEGRHAYPGPSRYTAAGSALIKALEAILGAYNHDGSDTMTDYFDVKFYGNASVDGTWEAVERERVRTNLAAELGDVQIAEGIVEWLELARWRAECSQRSVAA